MTAGAVGALRLVLKSTTTTSPSAVSSSRSAVPLSAISCPCTSTTVLNRVSESTNWRGLDSCHSTKRAIALRMRSCSRLRDQGVRKASRPHTASTSTMSMSTSAAQLLGGHPLGERVHDLSEVDGLVGGRDAARLAAEEPLGRTRHQRLEHAGRDRDRPLRIAHRSRRPRRGAGPPPRGRVGLRHELDVRRPPRRRGRRGAGRRPPAAAARWPGSATVRRSSATRPPSDSGRGGRPSRCTGLISSSARNRDGCSPSSSVDFTAVTTSRLRARVQAT